MTQQPIFSIRDYKIDLSRSVIEQGERQTKMEPKVLKVLYVLAQHPNEVVTHQTLMAQVWQGAEVVPNALQRCIAILRKELGDDAKSPAVIATHPKIGYRLLCEVTWQSPPSAQSTPHSVKRQRLLGLTPAVFATAFIAILLLIITLFWTETPNSHYTHITELTHTDAHESHAIYSPNAQYIVFNRYAGSCNSHIWSKELSTGKEVKLTASAGQFGAPSFTVDGRELVFTANDTCEQTASSHLQKNTCWTLATLDFAQALTQSQAPSIRYQCQATQIKNPKALSNHQYAFLQSDGTDYTLIHYNDLTKQITPLFSDENSSVYHFDYHPIHKKFALFAYDGNNHHQLILLDKFGQLLQQAKLTTELEFDTNQFFTAKFSTQGEYLLAVYNQYLYKIELDGQVSEVNTPSSSLISVSPHPTNSTLLAVQGSKDIDIARIYLHADTAQQTELDLNTVVTPYPSLARTQAQERMARFAPNGQSIAFISDQTGQDEIWLWLDSGNAVQLTHRENNSKIHNFAWSADSHTIAWVENGKLALTNIKGNDLKIPDLKSTDLKEESKFVSTHQPLFSVLNWRDSSTLLVLIKHKLVKHLYQLNINTNTLTPYNIGGVENAWVSHKQLIYSTAQGEIFSRALEPNLVPARALTQLNGKALLVKNGFIYSVDKQTFDLNQYNLDGQFIRTLKTLKPTAWKVTDLHNEQLLLEQFIGIDQEVVILN
ncbi:MULTISPECIES: winged helix-turn-helix domain-containing protein [Pseudoalteromonas]|uniref:OmpR/PhoB-type domain-containing protein n=1 Tax=Pseudoalteromonas amylolytica TaxID=1859457 RepID=A0A1S1MYL0_9GAMM|nr:MULTISPECIES: winged helix-turn-helix domain-containing protein [Pseudoalteromonas]OHU90546.1 hypothetical protein BFC16_02765 [Pseudoalteromonas sp. JW3]OHU92832.1 hypothetical protein BET10_05130 [Pseudoalteromonas amylolytica]